MGDFNDPEADVVGLVKWMSGEIARLRSDAENGWTARDHWKQRCQAADAVVEAARDVDYAHDNHLARLWDRINNLHDALRAYDAANEGVIET